MPHFPIEYAVEVRTGASSPLELTCGHRAPIAAGPPPDFGGSDAWWSPEHLLVSAAASCLAATFSAMAARSHVNVGTIHVRARGALERTPAGIAFGSIHLALAVHVLGSDVERATKVADEAKRGCFVANSLKCPVDVSVHVTAS